MCVRKCELAWPLSASSEVWGTVRVSFLNRRRSTASRFRESHIGVRSAPIHMRMYSVSLSMLQYVMMMEILTGNGLC